MGPEVDMTSSQIFTGNLVWIHVRGRQTEHPNQHHRSTVVVEMAHRSPQSSKPVLIE